MSQWIDQLRDHSVWQTLNALGPAIDQALEREGIESATVDGLARLKAALAFIGKRLAGADAYLVIKKPLDNISTNLTNSVTEVQAFISDGNAGHITNANAHADSALLNLTQLNVPVTTEDFVAAKEAADAYRHGLNSVLASTQTLAAQVQTDLESLKTKLSDLTTEVSTERQRLSSLASDHQSQFSTAQESRSREWAEAQKDRQEKHSVYMAEIAQRMVDIEKDFAQLRKAAEDQHSEVLENLKMEFVESASLIRDKIDERKREVEKLVGVIGNLGVTSGYQLAANEARTTTRVWQIVAVLSMLGLIGLAVYAFLPLVGDEFSWSSFAGRVFISLTVGVLAAYAVSQADKYQKIERTNRKLALELEAIGPYIAPLPLEKQEQFRMTIGDRSFGHDDISVHGSDKSPATIMDLFKTKEFREIITDVVKTAKP